MGIIVDMLRVENEKPSGNPGFLFLGMPDIFYRESIFRLNRAVTL